MQAEWKRPVPHAAKSPIPRVLSPVSVGAHSAAAALHYSRDDALSYSPLYLVLGVGEGHWNFSARSLAMDFSSDAIFALRIASALAFADT